MKRSPWEPGHRASDRHRVAVEAARLLYHREVKEYFQAKRMAARHQGTRHLPSNREIQQQLQLIAQIQDPGGHHHRLQHMRELAARLMEDLQEFHPRLIGSVLKGTIRKDSDIDINVYSDEVESVCQVLGERGYPYQVNEHRVFKQGEVRHYTHLRVTGLEGYEAEVTVYELSERHHRPRCSITLQPMARATLAELKALLQSPPPSPHYEVDDLLLAVTELESCRGVLQNHYHHLDVYHHTLAVVRGLQEMVEGGFQRLGAWAEALQSHIADPTLLYLAGICHDLGKPETQATARDGRITFHGHEHHSARLAGAIAPRLGLPAEPLVRLVECHMEAVKIPGEEAPPSRIHGLFARTGNHLPELALLSLADVEAARGPAQLPHRLEEHFAFVQFLLEQFFSNGFLRSPTVPVCEEDLAEELAVRQPKMQKKLLSWLTDRFVDGDFESREEGLCLASEWLAFPQSG